MTISARYYKRTLSSSKNTMSNAKSAPKNKNKLKPCRKTTPQFAPIAPELLEIMCKNNTKTITLPISSNITY